MSCLDFYSKSSATSSGSWTVETLRTTILVGVLMVSPFVSTSANTAVQNSALVSRTAMQTTPGLPVDPTSRRVASRTIAEVRRLSGLTWDQISRIFGVTRRAVHFWASGQALSSDNEERLERTVGVLRMVDRGSSSANRNALLTTSADGKIPFQLLIEQKYDEVVAILGRGIGVEKGASRMDRKFAINSPIYQPLPAIDLLDASQEPLRAARGMVRAIKFARVPSGAK